MPDDILLNIDGPVATVTFNRPRQRNAISYGMWLELAKLARRLEADGSVRCVVFRGAGDEAFSAGADIKDFPLHRYDSNSARNYASAFEEALGLIERLPVPTVSMIRGYCIGGGLEFATCTDIRIASEGSRFGVPAARLGLLVGFKETRRLVALAGPGAASFLLYTGRIVGHEDARRWGLVTSVVPPGELEEYVYAIARDAAATAPLSHRGHKAIIRKTLEDPSLSSLSDADLAIQFEVFDSEDFREGRQASAEKRLPKFTGS